MNAKKIGPYRLERLVGEGGMGSVHLAKREQLGVTKWVALKTIHPHLSHDAEFVASFLDEAKIAAALTHPNVTQVFEFGKADGQFYLAMEYVHGETLAEIVNGGPLAPALAAIIIANAAEGLHHAHQLQDEHGKAMGLVHRDISPQNIFLSYEGHVKVSDFGIAWVKERRVVTKLGHVKGKLAYMPREQLHQETLDRRTDVFALGVVLWELLVGFGPFLAETDAQTALRITKHDVHRPSSAGLSIPAALDTIVMKAIAADKADRYPTARALTRALEEFLVAEQWRAGPIELASEMAARFPVRRSEKEGWLHGRAAPRGAITPASFAHTAVSAAESLTPQKIIETSAFEADVCLKPDSDARAEPESAAAQTSAERQPTQPPAQILKPMGTKPVQGRSSPRLLGWVGLAFVVLAAALVGLLLRPDASGTLPLESDEVPLTSAAPPSTPQGRTMVAVSIGSNPPGATVELDGRTLGETPIQPLVRSGEHRLVLRLEGYQAYSQSFDTEQHDHRVRIELMANAPEPAIRDARPTSMSRVDRLDRVDRVDRVERTADVWSEMSNSVAPARLSLISNPWSAVKINGRRAAPTPFHNLEVPAGRVIIEYREQDQGEWHRLQLQLAPGEQHRQRLSY